MTKHHQAPAGKGSTTNAATDERLVRSSSPEVRGERGVAEDAERTNSVEELSDAELDELVASEFEQTALPQAPLIPGWHVCWLTTMSKYDTIAKRERLGYRPVLNSEVPGFDPSNGSTAAASNGVVTCNEMVLYKIPEPRYQAIMRYFHHRRPMEEEAAIVRAAKQHMESGEYVDSKGQALIQLEGEGLRDVEAQLAAAARVRPVFD